MNELTENPNRQTSTTLPSSEPSSRRLDAEEVHHYTEKLIAVYPDYSKAPPTYILAITELFTSLDEEVLKAMVNLRTGIPSKCQFLPSIAELNEFANNMERERELRRELEEKLAEQQKRAAEAKPESSKWLTQREYERRINRLTPEQRGKLWEFDRTKPDPEIARAYWKDQRERGLLDEYFAALENGA